MESTLAELKPEQEGIVGRIDLVPIESGVLCRLGLIPGTKIRCLRISPFGDPILYRFRGTDAALRRKTAESIQVWISGTGAEQHEQGGVTVWRIR